MTALICGSMAYDSIMVFPDQFKNHILPDKVHILNVCFLVPELRREFGGCAGNIAYNLKLLGVQSRIMATVGKDFDPYRKWLWEHGISDEHIKVIHESFTAQAYITTDADDNQITAFHPGAMSFAHYNKIPQDSTFKIGMVSPDGKEGMIEHADQFVAAGIPFIFDPGQGLPMFSAEELKKFIDQATWIIVNDYEAELLQSKTGLSLDEISRQVEALIVTKGSEGSEIYLEYETLIIPAIEISEAKDPTGCGDAYRAGIIYGLTMGYDWNVTGRVASLIGAIKVESQGTQNHTFTQEEFADRYKANFGQTIG